MSMQREARRFWRDVVYGRVQLALIPVAPIILLPFIIIGFVIVFPLWVAGLAVLGLLRLIAWVIDKAIEAAGGTFRLGPPLARAFEWVKTFGGLARTLTAKNASSDVRGVNARE
jgi:hypothetical protein